MRVNKRQELYFATVVFILLTVYFFAKGLDNFAGAAAIEENCTYGCSNLEEVAIDVFEDRGVINLVISVIMVALALFFWPQLTEEQKQKQKQIRQDLKDENAAKKAELERQAIELREKRMEKQKLLFKETYLSGDLSKIGPREIDDYVKYATWVDENKELRIPKEDYILGLNENSDESE